MKYILILLWLAVALFADTVKSPIVTLNENTATINIEKIDIGMSGFVVHALAETHSSILKSAVVKSFDADTKIATLELSDFGKLENDALPKGTWKVAVGDTVILAFGYTRGLLIAPSEEIYYRVTKATEQLQWVHPDIFATILSFNGHPTPLKEDFDDFSDSTAVGLVFFYLDKKLFTLDAQSFEILNISEAPLAQESVLLPFYTRVPEIQADWWGEGSDELEAYEPHYYELMVNYNKGNKKLFDIVKNGDETFHFLLKKFDIKG